METFYDAYKQKVDTLAEKYGVKTSATYMRADGSEDRVTFREVGDFAKNVSDALPKIGLRRGDRAAILSAQSPWTVCTGIALMYSGITVVPIDVSLPSEEVEKLLDFSDIRALFASEKEYARLNRAFTQKLPCFSLDKGLTLTAFPNEGAASFTREATPDPEFDVAAIIYSSGTTGGMKGVKIPYGSVLKARTVVERLAGLHDQMKYLLVLPFNHIAGFTSALTFYLTGSEIGFIENVDSTKLQSGLQKFEPHCFVMVPKVYEVMEQKIRAAIRAKGAVVYAVLTFLFKVSGFFRRRFGINFGRKLFHGIIKEVFGSNIFGLGTGASPCKPETAEFFLDLGLVWDNFYAATETNVPIAASGIFDRYPADIVGKVDRHPEIEIRIKDPDESGTGEIIVRSELMMKGYFRQDDLTEAAFENGFFKTGDYGYIDKKGGLHVTGRIKESIVLSNGKKVSPADVDDYYISKIPDHDIASRGMLCEGELYDEIHLFIADQNYTDAEKEKTVSLFEEESRRSPAIYKLSGIHFIPQIPRTSVGKVKRFCLEISDTDTISPSEKRSEPNKIGSSAADAVYDLVKSLRETDDDFPLNDKLRLKEDIGMDSLSIFELCASLDERFGGSVESELHENITIGEMISIVEKRNQTTVETDASHYPIRQTEKDRRNFRRFIKFSDRMWKFEVVGRENIDPSQNYIFCPNHESHFDGMWIIGHLDDTIQQRICSIAADYLFEKKIYRQGVIFMGGIPVHRSGNSAPAMKRALECISQEGYSLIVHPEGTRSRNGRLGELKLGAATLSIDSGVKIIPVCIDGAREVFPPNRSIPRVFDWKRFRKYSIRITFGAPISPEGQTAEEITEKIKQHILTAKTEGKK
ncbi:MAG: AMP-binding protein [Bacteroides sp.]|nr:AMP-binding protein [Eubacterium sp.]MCM1417375.1 AMP-binding protein [Roseburia sp.]MCM1461433.1 AMP-binding protein [Bacteroides sp.]